MNDSMYIVSRSSAMKKFIEAVRKNPCLWNTEVEEYKSHSMKDQAWKEVIKECNMPTVKDAQRKWKNLRDGHRQAVTKKKCSNTGTKWKYQELMKFLIPTMKKRCKSYAYMSRLAEEENQTKEDVLICKSEVIHQNEDSHLEEYLEPSEDDMFDASERNTKDFEVAFVDNEQRSVVSSSKNPHRNSGLEKFFLSMFETTSKLPDRLQIRVQRKIFNAVMEAKEEDITTQPICSISNTNSPQFTEN